MSDETMRCQSCGMPMGDGFFGTREDGGESKDYCKFCYQKGAFTEPNLTVAEMIKKSAEHMASDLTMDEDMAAMLAEEYIPKLKRWQGK